MQALHAEWTKLRTVPGTPWLLLGAIALTVVLSVAAAAAITMPVGSRQDTTKLILTGIDLGQVIIALLAVQTISSEYSTGMIRVTLAAMPRRHTVLAAKAAILSGVTLVAGTIAVLSCLLAGRLILPGKGFTPAHGYALLSLADGSTLRAAAGAVFYLALIALLSLGIATILRDTATATGVVLGLLYIFPIIAGVVTNPHAQRLLQEIGPMTGGLAIEATTNVRSLPIAPWSGLGVLATWAGAALLAGGLLLRLRDA